MKSNALRSQMRAALRTHNPISPDYQRRAYTLAQSSDDTELMALIAGRPDAPQDLLDLARASRKIEVRARFLTRPDLDSRTLRAELKDEKRAGVLTNVLRATRTTPALRSIVLAAFNEHPTKTLAEALMEIDLDHRTALLVVKELDSRVSRMSQHAVNRLVHHAENICINISSDELEDLSDTLTSRALCSIFLTRPDLSDAAQALLLSKVMTEGFLNAHDFSNDNDDLLTLIVTSLERFGAGSLTLKAVTSALGLGWSAPQRYELEKLVHQLGGKLPDPLVSTFETEMRASLLTRSPRRLRSATRLLNDSRVFLNRAYAGALATRLAENAACPRDVALLTLGFVNDSTAYDLAERFDDEEFLDKVILQFGNNLDELLRRYSDPTAALHRLGSALLVHHETLTYPSFSAITSLLNRLTAPGFDPEVAVHYLPWKVFVAEYNDFVPAAHALVAERLTEALGDDTESWEMFASLADEFDGTVAELLDVSLSLSGD